MVYILELVLWKSIRRILRDSVRAPAIASKRMLRTIARVLRGNADTESVAQIGRTCDEMPEHPNA